MTRGSCLDLLGSLNPPFITERHKSRWAIQVKTFALRF